MAVWSCHCSHWSTVLQCSSGTGNWTSPCVTNAINENHTNDDEETDIQNELQRHVEQIAVRGNNNTGIAQANKGEPAQRHYVPFANIEHQSGLMMNLLVWDQPLVPNSRDFSLNLV